MKGFYRRPSKAIEQGGGFFIPGLEGERVSIITAFALLIALLVNQIGQSFTTSNEVVSEVIGAAVIVVLFIQGISAAIGEEDVIEVTQTFLSILQSSNDDASERAEIISKSIIQSCEDTNYILVFSSQTPEPRLILEYAPIGVTPITKTSSLTELTSSVQQAGNIEEIASLLPINRGAAKSDNLISKMEDIDGNTWIISITKNRNNNREGDLEWISKLLQASWQSIRHHT